MSDTTTTQRLHPNLVKAVIETIRIVFAELEGGKGQYADSAVKKLLQSNPKWGANDRKFLAHSVYEIIRWWRKLWDLCGEEPSLNEGSLWSLAGIYLSVSGYSLPPWKEFEAAANIPWKKRAEDVNHIRGIRESVPDWLDETGVQELGEVWNLELHSLNQQAPVIIRVNTLKITVPELRKRLKEEGVETTVINSHPDALRFSEGLFEVQDASSQEVAYFMDVKPGMRIIDACAGGGGKTLHLAAIMQNKGKIIALDVHEWKLSELKKRAARAGVSIIETRSIASAKVIKRLEKSADRLLLDVPCSGLGVLRRNPDIKWKLSANSLNRIRKEQHEILYSYSKILKPGGKLVYSTCSILPSENEGIVDKFLAENMGFKKISERKILPSQSGFDGFYMAAIATEN
jgi:16S rRNA (cytosine967-C5)-methyltransferase